MSTLRRISGRYLGAGVAGSTERKVELLAIALGLLLLAQLVYGVVRLATLSAPDAIPPSLEGATDAQPAAVERVTAEQREEVAARPLFWTSRRPAPPSGAEGPAGAGGDRGDLEKVDIVGVFGSGSTAGVIVRVEDNRQRLLLGESLNGWTLEAVHPDRVDFSRNARQATLVLEHRKVAAAPVKAGSSGARGAQRKQRPAAAARAQRRQAQQQEQPSRGGNTEPRGKDNDNNGAPPAQLGFGR